MTDGNGFRLLHHIDVDKTLKRIKQCASASKEAENPDKGTAAQREAFTIYCIQ